MAVGEEVPGGGARGLFSFFAYTGHFAEVRSCGDLTSRLTVASWRQRGNVRLGVDAVEKGAPLSDFLDPWSPDPSRRAGVRKAGDCEPVLH